jgi:hypothetical protein
MPLDSTLMLYSTPIASHTAAVGAVFTVMQYAITGANPLTSINSTLGVNPMIKQHVNNAARLQVRCLACCLSQHSTITTTITYSFHSATTTWNASLELT